MFAANTGKRRLSRGFAQLDGNPCAARQSGCVVELEVERRSSSGRVLGCHMPETIARRHAYGLSSVVIN
jgi:hypothetical protein